MKHLGFALNIICLAGIIYLINKDEHKQTAFFLSAEVYNEFEYKKELEFDLENSNNLNNQRLDSLEMDLKMNIDILKNAIDKPSNDKLIVLERKQNYYIDYRNEIEYQYTTKVQESYTLIWERINEYVAEYGEQNGYQFIFGANGDGSLMYADETADITEEIITYVNERYAGV